MYHFYHMSFKGNSIASNNKIELRWQDSQISVDQQIKTLMSFQQYLSTKAAISKQT